MSETEVMSPEEVQRIRQLAEEATPGPWKLWTGNSWRRFGSEVTGHTVIEPTTHPIDRHPDLSFRNDADATYVEAMHPLTTLRLCTTVEALREERDRLRSQIAEILARGMLHVWEGDCPDETQPDARDLECPGCKLLDLAGGEANHASTGERHGTE